MNIERNTKELAHDILLERTFVLIKPDGFLRGLTGEIINRITATGLKLVAMKMFMATSEQIKGHFPTDKEWMDNMGRKTLDSYSENGIDPISILGTDDASKIGEMIYEWNLEYFKLGPVVGMVYEGVGAISTVRKLIGNTLPYKAEPGTIRGDHSCNTPELANIVGSACKNIIHASGDDKEAKQEISNWFQEDELINYDRLDTHLAFLAGSNY